MLNPTPQRSDGPASPGEAIPTYYGRPALKPSLYGWMVALYIFIGGLAGAAQVIATIMDFLGVPDSAGIILCGRALALAGAVTGGILLIADLHTKQRFYNMLRIFRPTSSMSIGTYVLMSFGFWSLAALVCELFGPHWLTLIFGGLAGIAGWFMTAYPASLLAATSTPLWVAAPAPLGIRFAASAMASGAAALCIAALALGVPRAAAALSIIAVVALAIELIAAILAQFVYAANGVAGPLVKPPWGAVHILGAEIGGVAAPIALFILGLMLGPAFGFFLAASLCVLAGSLLMRGTLFEAGNESAKRPLDYFRFAGEQG
jgi:Polysulphide reductase, NrfD